MPEDSGSYRFPLKGEYRGRKYHMAVRPDFTSMNQDPEEIEDFAVVIYNVDEEGEKQQVVRIDTAHGQVHMDKNYSQRDDIKEFFDDMSFMEACTYLQSNWKKFAKWYEQK